MIHLTINQKPVAVPEGTTILEAARSAGIEIPSLCYLKTSTGSAPAASAWWRWRACAPFRPPA